MKEIILQKRTKEYPTYMLCEFKGLIPDYAVVLKRKIKYQIVFIDLPYNFKNHFSDLYSFCQEQGFGIEIKKLKEQLYEVIIF